MITDKNNNNIILLLQAVYCGHHLLQQSNTSSYKNIIIIGITLHNLQLPTSCLGILWFIGLLHLKLLRTYRILNMNLFSPTL